MFRLFAAMFKNNAIASALPMREEQAPVPEPRLRRPFIFPQTRDAWRAAVENLPQEYARQDAAHLQELQRLDEEIQSLESMIPKGQDAQQEMERREALRFLESARRARSKEVSRASNQRNSRRYDLYFGSGDPGRLEEEFHAAEGKMIVQGGTILSRRVLQGGRITGRRVITACDEYRPKKLDRRERILVVHNGQPYLAEIAFEAAFTAQNVRSAGVGGEMAHDIVDWTFEGRYGELKVEWLTGSLEQFTSQELLVLRTYEFAELKHRGQVRGGEKKLPYITHPLGVAALVAEASGSAETICAALLHDVMEDCGVKGEEILALYPDPNFGQRVLAVVLEMTDPEGLSYEEKKERQIAMMASGYSPEGVILKAADQISNMRDLVSTPPQWGNGEEVAYIAAMRRLVDAGGERIPQELKAAFDAAYGEACRFYGMAQ